MFGYDIQQKLRNIVRGTRIEAAADHSTAARNFLCASFSTSKAVKRDFESQLIVKEEQARQLSQYARTNNIWLDGLPKNVVFLAAGGEAKVYFDAINRTVIKLNDAGYYATWLEYFNSLVLHNTIFPGTAYDFLGLINENEVLKAVVRQPFIVADGQVELGSIKQLLAANGFENTRRQDYYNPEFGIILEDMHDENVLINSGTLFFIDTVFYTIDPSSPYK